MCRFNRLQRAVTRLFPSVVAGVLARYRGEAEGVHVQRETSRGPSLSDVLLLLLAGRASEAVSSTAAYSPAPFISAFVNHLCGSLCEEFPFEVLRSRLWRACPNKGMKETLHVRSLDLWVSSSDPGGRCGLCGLFVLSWLN